MPNCRSLAKTYTVGALILTTFLSSNLYAVDATNTTKKPPAEPFFEAGGFIYHMMPQVSEKKPMTFTELDLIFNLLRTPQTLTQLEIDLAAFRKWDETAGKNTTSLDSTEIYLQQLYSLDSSSKLLYGLKVALPSNDTDRTAGFNYAGGAVLGYITSVFGSNLVLIADPTFYKFTWQTSNPIGDEYNTKYSLGTMAKLSTPLTKTLKWRNIARLYTYSNYADNTYQTISFNTQIAWEIMPTIAVYGGVATKDRVDKVTSTQRAFSNELVNLRLGLEWSI